MEKAATKKNSTIATFILDLIILLTGISLIIWSDRVTSAISIALGVIFLIVAAYDFIAYIRLKEKSGVTKIITPIALSIAGVFLIAQHDFLKELISVIVGLAVTIISIFKIQDALTLKNMKGNYQTPLTLALIGLLCGILCLAGRIIVTDFILQILGAIMAIFAFIDIAGSFMLSRGEKTIEETAIEAEIIQKD